MESGTIGTTGMPFQASGVSVTIGEGEGEGEGEGIWVPLDLRVRVGKAAGISGSGVLVVVSSCGMVAPLPQAVRKTKRITIKGICLIDSSVER
jgi:hypothetical protein